MICIVLFLIIGKLRVFGHGEHVYRLIGRGYLRNEIEQIFMLGGLFVLLSEIRNLLTDARKNFERETEEN